MTHDLQKAKSPVAAGQIAEQSTESMVSVPPPEEGGNAARIIAALGAAGFLVHKLSDGFAVCRWTHAKHCPDLPALAAFARQVGARG